MIGPLCARDHKGVGDEYLREGKVVVVGYLGDTKRRNAEIQ